MAHEFTISYLGDSLSLFRYYKKLTERALEQVADEQLFAVLDGDMNRNHRQASRRKHAIALDGFPDQGRREAGPRARYRV
jgi:hypothetical protein